MIAIVTTELSGYLFKEINAKQASPDDYVDCTKDTNNISRLFGRLEGLECSKYLLDLEAIMTPDPDDMVRCVLTLKEAKQVPVIIFAQGYEPNSGILEALRIKGIRFIVAAEYLSDLRIQLEECLKGCENAVGVGMDQVHRIQDAEEPTEFSLPYKEVAFLGSIPRVGTTTMAIQFARYMQARDYAVCYIKMNDAEQITMLPSLVVPELFDWEKGYLRYKKLDMFYNPSMLTEADKRQYDVCVYDYGVENDAVLPGFLSKQVKVCIGGVKPWEQGALMQLVQLAAVYGAWCCCTFAAKNLQREWSDRLPAPGGNIFFSAYTPDPFVLQRGNHILHEKIIKQIYPKAKIGAYGFISETIRKSHNAIKLQVQKRAAQLKHRSASKKPPIAIAEQVPNLVPQDENAENAIAQ